jgi:hypothetical protein
MDKTDRSVVHVLFEVKYTHIDLTIASQCIQHASGCITESTISSAGEIEGMV